jgi:hypothetical protein
MEWLQLTEVQYPAKLMHNLFSTDCLTKKEAEMSIYKDRRPVAAQMSHGGQA